VVSVDKDFAVACEPIYVSDAFSVVASLLELLLSDDKRLEQARAIVDVSISHLIDAVQDAVDSVPIHHTERAFNGTTWKLRT